MSRKISYTEEDLLVAINILKDQNSIISERNIRGVLQTGSAHTIHKSIEELLEKGSLKFSAFDKLSKKIKMIYKCFVERNKHKIKSDISDDIYKSATSEVRHKIESDLQKKYDKLEKELRHEFQLQFEKQGNELRQKLLEREIELKDQQIKLLTDILKSNR
ncbi:hypothetical protein JCM19233_6194 [Vibrio astriarenae]|nr:hypothetical protein JCM19233_6194 [Vibrio sp. C7]